MLIIRNLNLISVQSWIREVFSSMHELEYKTQLLKYLTLTLTITLISRILLVY